MQCEDCKYASWDYRLFIHYVKSNFRTEYFTEQFDVLCTKLNCFLVEDDISGNCRFGKNGHNNYHVTCACYYKQLDEFNSMIKEFRKSIENDIDAPSIYSYEEFVLFKDYLKKKNPELYNKMID